jgi:hypothetical protein
MKWLVAILLVLGVVGCKGESDKDSSKNPPMKPPKEMPKPPSETKAFPDK